MSYEPYAHPAQAAMLRQLLFVRDAGFAELQRAADLASDHATFHIKKLVKEGFVAKRAERYTLTPKGKEYANRMDTDDNVIERQPKVSVVVVVERRNEHGEREILFQERRKQPYFGFWGLPQGKVRWGETIAETAVRELLEETGIRAAPRHRLLYHVRDFDKQSGELLEDKLFLCAHATSSSGKLFEEFEGGRNAWMTQQEFQSQARRFNNVDDIITLLDAGETIAEREFFYEPTEY